MQRLIVAVITLISSLLTPAVVLADQTPSQQCTVFALDRESGCSFWRFQAGTQVRTGLGIATIAGRQLVFFGDLAG